MIRELNSFESGLKTALAEHDKTGSRRSDDECDINMLYGCPGADYDSDTGAAILQETLVEFGLKAFTDDFFARFGCAPPRRGRAVGGEIRESVTVSNLPSGARLVSNSSRRSQIVRQRVGRSQILPGTQHELSHRWKQENFGDLCPGAVSKMTTTWFKTDSNRTGFSFQETLVA
jgi:hypothetical protein